MEDMKEKSFVNFIEKLKKQAKKVLKLSKENNFNIKINNLSEAQEFLSKINGYPNWHALTTNVNKPSMDLNENVFVEKIDNVIKSNLKQENDIFYDEYDEYIVSSFVINDIPLDSFEVWWHNFYEQIAFQWNLGIHEIILSLDFKFIFGENKKELNNVNFNKFYNFESVNVGLDNGFVVKPKIIIKTIKIQKEEHFVFCEFFKSEFVCSKAWVETDLNLLNKNSRKNLIAVHIDLKEDLDKNVFKQKNMDKNYHRFDWLNVLQLINKKQKEVSFIIDFKAKERELVYVDFKNNDQSYKDYIFLISDNLKNRIIPLYKQENNPQIYNERKEFYLPENVEMFSFVNQKTIGHTGVFAKPGSGKSSFMSAKVLNSHTTKANEFHGVVDIGNSYQEIICFLNDKEKDKHKYLKVNEENFKYNIFNLNLEAGLDSLKRNNLINFLHLIINKNNSKELGMFGLISSYLDSFAKEKLEKNPNFFKDKYNRAKECSKDLVSYIEKYNLQNETFYNIAKFLHNKGLYKEAQEAQNYMGFNLIEFITFIQMSPNETYKSVVVNSTGEDVITFMIRELKSFISLKFPCLHYITEVDVDFDIKTLVIDLDLVAKSGGHLATFASQVNYFLAFDFLLNFQTSRQKNIYLDEFHRGCNTELQDTITSLLRNANQQKNSVVLNIISQSLDNFSPAIYGFLGVFFIFNKIYIEEELNKLKNNFNFTKSDLIKIKNLPHAIGNVFLKIKTLKNEEISQTFKFVPTKEFIWLTSNLPEHIAIKQKLKLPIWEKLTYLANKYPKGISNIVEIKLKEYEKENYKLNYDERVNLIEKIVDDLL